MKKLPVAPLFIIALALVSAISFLPPYVEAAQNTDYPTKRIEFVVGWGVGGGTDIFARQIALPLEEILSAGIGIINKPGSAGVIGNSYLQSKKADGYTIINANPGLVSNFLQGRDDYSYNDFIPVLRAQFEPGMWVVAYENKFKSIEEVIRYAKDNPGKLKLAGAGALGLDEIASRMFMGDAAIDLTYVPFDTTSEMHAALLGGHVDLMYEEPSIAFPLVESKKMRPVVIFNDKRLEVFGDVVCTGDLGFEAPPGTWRGVAVKKGTPIEIVKFLEEAFSKAMNSPSYKKYEKDSLLNLNPGYLNSKDFQKYWETEEAKYTKVLGKLGLLKK